MLLATIPFVAALDAAMWEASQSPPPISTSTSTTNTNLSLWWMAPFFSGGGYSSEAIGFAQGLDGRVHMRISQHGDALKYSFVAGLDADLFRMLLRMLSTLVDVGRTVVVCHSEPGAWYPPLYSTEPCPHPYFGSPAYVVGRTMFETDRITKYVAVVRSLRVDVPLMCNVVCVS
jgi:hypothetical protein